MLSCCCDSRLTFERRRSARLHERAGTCVLSTLWRSASRVVSSVGRFVACLRRAAQHRRTCGRRGRVAQALACCGRVAASRRARRVAVLLCALLSAPNCALLRVVVWRGGALWRTCTPQRRAHHRVGLLPCRVWPSSCVFHLFYLIN